MLLANEIFNKFDTNKDNVIDYRDNITGDILLITQSYFGKVLLKPISDLDITRWLKKYGRFNKE